jgi:4-amino-4-deoxy-L-arabinose transferase-like glycosyltransferase
VRSGARSARASSSRRAIALLCALLGTHAALAWALRQRLVTVFEDDASYLLLARSLRSLSYRELQYIGEPIAGRFPPFYPAALAVWTSLFGESLAAVAVLGTIASVSTLVALFLIVRRCWSLELALLVVAVVAVNPPFATMAGAMASEAVFTALTMWALWAARVGDDASAPRRFAFLAGALAILAALARSAGITLVGALGLHWLVRRRWGRVVPFAVASALTVGLWLAWTLYAPQQDLRASYVDAAVNVRAGDGSLTGTFATRVKDNVTAYAGQTLASELRLPLSSRTRIDNLAWLAFIGAFGLVGFASAWGRWRIGTLHVVAYVSLLAIWPYTIERFLTPVVPLVILFMLAGAWAIADHLTSRAASYGPVAIAAVLAGSAIVENVRLVEREAECARTRSACSYPAALEYVEAARFAATLPGSDTVLVAPKSAALYYYSGRRSPFWDEVLSLDSAAFVPYLRKQGIRYAIAGPVVHDYDVLYRLLLANCEQFDIVKAYSPESFVVRLRDTPRDEGRAAPLCTTAARALTRPISR